MEFDSNDNDNENYNSRNDAVYLDEREDEDDGTVPAAVNQGNNNDHHAVINHDDLDLPEAEEMDLETLRDPLAANFDEDDEDEDGDGGGGVPIETNRFVSLWRELIKPEPFDLYRHACSWAVNSYDGKPGYVATYLLRRLLPPLLEPNDDDNKTNDGTSDTHCRRLVTRLLRKGEAKSYNGNEEGFYEVALLHKWENTTRFHDMLSFDSIIKAYSYTLTCTNWYAGLNQMIMLLKQNGMHQELETGRIGHRGQRQQQEHNGDEGSTSETQRREQQQQQPPQQVQQQEEYDERHLFVMIRRRKLTTSTSMAQFHLVLQIMNRLSEVSLQEEPNQCLMYDIHTLRDVDPLNESKREEAIEIGIWSTMEDYFDGHLSKEYVKQSTAIDVCFDELNDESITYWELLAPHGLFVSNPDVSFMDDEVTKAPSV